MQPSSPTLHTLIATPQEKCQHRLPVSVVSGAAHLVSSHHRQLPSDDPKDKSLRGSDRETLGAIQLAHDDQSTFQETVHLECSDLTPIMWWCTILLEKLRERASFSA
ncbi:hypothetical protein QQF64_002471 [Cirrhinus molitorella]|uniref:Uncharacterized protein n=1 Tax=Cirrhinus molitorella TaxID=172907 RepID=A0ABR3MQ91_9TELE